MKSKVKKLVNILRSKKRIKKEKYPVTDASFLDVHHHYDKNDYIHTWKDLINSNPELWAQSVDKSLEGKKVLIATLGGGFSHRPFMTMDNLISIALTLRGAKVENYYCDHALPVCLKAEYAYIKPEMIHHSRISDSLCKGCYKDITAVSLQTGLKNHMMNAYITLGQKEAAKEVARNISIAHIKDYQLDNVPVGKHAVSGAMRYFAHSDPTQIPMGAEIMRKYLEASIITYYSVRRLLEEEKFESVCLTHGSYTPHGVIKEVCDRLGIPVTSWTVAYLKGRFIFTHGEILHSMLHEPNESWENIKWEEKQETRIMDYLNSRWTGSKDWLSIPKDNQRISFADFAKEQKMDLNKPIIGLLTNIIWESYAEYKSRVFSDMLIWIKKTIQYFEKRKDLQLLIRIHPAEKQWHVSRQLALDEIKKMFKKLPANVFIINSDVNVSTYEAMEYCDSVLIYQTQTGLELAAQGIPVIAAGDAFVRNKGITYEPCSEQEYYQQLDMLPFKKPLSEDRVHRAKKYAYHAFYRKMIPLSFTEESNDWMLYKTKIKKLDELLPNVDPGLDIICKGILNEGQFVYPAEEYEDGAQ